MRPYYKYDDGNRRVHYTTGGQSSFGAPLTPAVKWLIGVNVAVFLFGFALGGRPNPAYMRFVSFFAFTPADAIGGLRIWQFVTYMFLHADFTHIFFNLFFFWMIGGLAEGRLGTKRFLWLYVLSGLAGAVGQALVAYVQDAGGVPANAFPQIYVPTVGASGAIMGVAAAVATLYPNMPVLVFFILPMKMKHFIWVLVFFQFWGLGAASAVLNGSRTAYFAHLAGLGAGYLFVRYHEGAGWFLSKVARRLRGRFRGVSRPPSSTPIDNDAEYREEVDRLLDKIFKEGTQSLTKEENEFLKKQSERYKK